MEKTAGNASNFFKKEKFYWFELKLAFFSSVITGERWLAYSVSIAFVSWNHSDFSVMTNFELLHHDDHLLWTEKMMCIQLSWMWSSNRKRLHRIQWRTFGQWKRTQKWNIFLFTSSGNKQKATFHMRDTKKFNERVNDCCHWRYDCEIDMKKRMNKDDFFDSSRCLMMKSFTLFSYLLQ